MAEETKTTEETQVVTGEIKALDDSDTWKAPKPNWYWMKNSAGEASASLTFATISFMAVILWFVLAMFEAIVIGGWQLTIRPFDSTAAAILLGTTFSLYWGRRFTNPAQSLIK